MPKAVVFSEYGSPDVLRLTDVDMPAPGPGQVRVRVHVAGVNPVESKRRRGEGFEGAGAPITEPQRLGSELAGTVDAIGEGVTEFQVGSAVFGRAIEGAYAEYALCAVEDLVAKPPSLSWGVAGSLAMSAETAVRALAYLGVIPPHADGMTVLIHGASGAVGSIATQLAVHRGAQVIGTASEMNQDRVRSYGACPIVYGEGWSQRARKIAPAGIDAVLDSSGAGVLVDSLALTGNPRKIVTIADQQAHEMGIHYSRGMVTRLPTRSVFNEVVPLLLDGTLKITIGAEYPLSRVKDAHRLSESYHPGGRIILGVRPH